MVVMLLLFSAAALFAGTKKRVQRERERERVVLFSCCLIFVEDFFSRLALVFLALFSLFLGVVDFLPNKNTHTNNTDLTKKTR